MSPDGGLHGLSGRLTHRGDSEHIQAAIRIAVVAATTALMFGIDPAGQTHPDALAFGRIVMPASLLVSIGILVAIAVSPAPSVPRRFFGMVHDATLLSITLYSGEAVLASFSTLYLLLAVANGFRYGTNYLYAATAMALVGFTIVYRMSPYWHAEPTLSINVFVMLGVLPLYIGQLLKSLHRARGELRRQASFDTLTGLLNRAELERRVETLLTAAPDGHALLFCDLDHFKAVNDAAGHTAGDKLLADVGSLIRSSVRATDLCARPGGDEFCVLLTDCKLDKARAIAEQIRSRVAGYRLAWGQQYFSVGISVGVAPSSAVADMKSLFRLADAACYAAKNAGRNQIHVVDPRIDDVDTASVRRLYLAPENGDPTRRERIL